MKHRLYITLLCTAVAALFTTQPVQAQLPNLYSAHDSLTFSGDPGPVSISITMGNNGAADYPGGLIGLYLSLDTVLNTAEDSLIYSFVLGSAPAADTGNFSVTMDFCSPVIQSSFPEYAFTNSFYILYVLDYSNLSPETNENDNTGVLNPPLTIGCVLGIDAITKKNFSVSPNPFSDALHFTFSQAPHSSIQLQLTDVLGRTLCTQQFPPTASITYHTPALPAGIYFYRIAADGKLSEGKVMKD